MGRGTRFHPKRLTPEQEARREELRATINYIEISREARDTVWHKELAELDALAAQSEPIAEIKESDDD